jgi:hypothetical protein
MTTECTTSQTTTSDVKVIKMSTKENMNLSLALTFQHPPLLVATTTMATTCSNPPRAGFQCKSLCNLFKLIPLIDIFSHLGNSSNWQLVGLLQIDEVSSRRYDTWALAKTRSPAYQIAMASPTASSSV